MECSACCRCSEGHQGHLQMPTECWVGGALQRGKAAQGGIQKPPNVNLGT